MVQLECGIDWMIDRSIDDLCTHEIPVYVVIHNRFWFKGAWVVIGCLDYVHIEQANTSQIFVAQQSIGTTEHVIPDLQHCPNFDSFNLAYRNQSVPSLHNASAEDLHGPSTVWANAYDSSIMACQRLNRTGGWSLSCGGHIVKYVCHGQLPGTHKQPAQHRLNR